MKYKFGERIKALRKAAGETQVELAQALGVTQSSLSSLESGIFNASKSTAQIADHYGVSAIWLATGEGNKEITAATSDSEEMVRHYGRDVRVRVLARDGMKLLESRYNEVRVPVLEQEQNANWKPNVRIGNQWSRDTLSAQRKRE